MEHIRLGYLLIMTCIILGIATATIPPLFFPKCKGCGTRNLIGKNKCKKCGYDLTENFVSMMNHKENN